MAILVTGGAGFIGSNLCNLLLNEGHSVIAVDNFATSSVQNIQDVKRNKRFTFIEADVCSDITSTLNKLSIEAIYHLASPAHVAFVTKNPVQSALTNSIGTNNLLLLATERNIPILFASSSEAYGDPLKNPQSEDYWGNVNPVGVRSGYDEGKRFGEALCMAYMREHKTQVRIVRIFNTYGPNSSETDSRVLPQFIQASLKNRPITIYGDGTNTRSFCYVDDLVKGLYQVMQQGVTGPINLGSDKEITILDLARMVKTLSKSRSKIIYKKALDDDPKIRRPDLTLARNRIEWAPMVELQSGIKKTIHYYKDLILHDEK